MLICVFVIQSVFEKVLRLPLFLFRFGNHLIIFFFYCQVHHSWPNSHLPPQEKSSNAIIIYSAMAFWNLFYRNSIGLLVSSVLFIRAAYIITHDTILSLSVMLATIYVFQ